MNYANVIRRLKKEHLKDLIELQKYSKKNDVIWVNAKIDRLTKELKLKTNSTRVEFPTLVVMRMFKMEDKGKKLMKDLRFRFSNWECSKSKKEEKEYIDNCLDELEERLESAMRNTN